jgi:hypothetical protein
MFSCSRRQSLPLLAFGPVAAFAFQRTLPAPPPVRWRPRAPFNGSPILFESKEPRPNATWLGKKIEFRKDGDLWTALAGVDLATKAGRHPLTWGEDQRVQVPVVARAYAASRITVAPKFVQPPPEVSKRIAEEQAVKKKVFAGSPMAERYWQGRFQAPTRTAQTSPFGTRRVYNGKTRSIHQGLDFGAPSGTEILAANGGRVVIARDMYFEGGFVVIDHGEAIFTLYMHLSAFLVKEGAMVEKGQPMAKSGASGRVTGPHLHFGVQWQGAYLEPGTLLAL